MTGYDRRGFLRMLGGTAALSMLGASIARAADIDPHYRTGTIEDVDHIVILMQENRSFDHYLGTMRGVRGFGDPRPLVLPSRRAVWYQEQGPEQGGGVVVPYRPTPVDGQPLGLTSFEDIPHDWDSGHEAFNGGRYDRWVRSKDYVTMAHFEDDDIPFHRRLADAFTVCDSYHCSLNGWTDPNRYYMWTGCVDARGRGGGPVIDNYDAKTSPARRWPTYPERLEQHGVSWKVYQDVGRGLTLDQAWGWVEGNACIGNYGDNSLLHFEAYQEARPGSALYEKARTGTRIDRGEGNLPDFDGLFSILRSDVQSGRLPQVSWIAAPEIFNEHPISPPNYGAWYVSKVIDALTSDPAVWSRTALIITYDENGGFFDHVVPPYPPENAGQGRSTVSVAEEFYHGPDGLPGPFGLGPRVPAFVVSPWSRGGWVCSEVFDHTSLIRFVEQRFHVREDQITPWRRTVCGDLTSAFDFAQRTTDLPPLPSTAAYLPPQCQEKEVGLPRPDTSELPQQETGLRRARALPYDLEAHALVRDGELRLSFSNHGRAGAAFHVTSHTGDYGPWTYTVEPDRELTDTWRPAGAYDFHVHGPAGFLREFAGNPAQGRPEVEVTARHRTDEEDGCLALRLTNRTGAAVRLTLHDAYRDQDDTVELAAGEQILHRLDCRDSHRWYDATITSDLDPAFRRRLAGHVETGRPSTSDPAFGQTLLRAGRTGPTTARPSGHG
ncbi:phosphocholine-specific phospholipase C [Kitasatospora sp. NPDC015120]|uniref:phosphocholine-specific phospholipase C n=1 Tax=Kitasatospora sp. NPDC015120 TaxID=3364023 RepID=UPI0036F4650C